MLKVIARTATGTQRGLSGLFGLSIRRECDTPADIMEASFDCEISQDIAFVSVLKDDKQIFCGVVDEQSVVYGNRITTTIIARSMMALLLDNEACPEIFVNPSFSLVFNRYCKEFGFICGNHSDAVFEGVLNVEKGMSCYQVMRTFCKQVFASEPYVEGDVFYPQGMVGKHELTFSQTGTGVIFEQMETNRKRYELISEIRAKTGDANAYDLVITDSSDALAGVCRRRYVDVPTFPYDAFLKAKNIILNAKKRCTEIELLCAGCYAHTLGAKAKVNCNSYEHKGYYVSSIYYTLKNKKEQTKIKLLKGELQDVADIIYGKEY